MKYFTWKLNLDDSNVFCYRWQILVSSSFDNLISGINLLLLFKEEPHKTWLDVLTVKEKSYAYYRKTQNKKMAAKGGQ